MKRWSWVVATVSIVSAAALGVEPGQWRHTTAEDFAAGELDGVMATSRGELRLAPRLEVLLTAADAPPVISTVAVGPDAVYAGAATAAKVYRVADGAAELLASPPGAMITALLQTDDGLLAGTGGEEAGIYRIDADGEVARVWTDEAVRYVWAIVPRPDGGLYAATGPQGKVFAVDGEGRGRELYAAGELADNVLCLVLTQRGLLYAGTDKNGLVVEIDPVERTSRVVLDAEEAEIAALVAAGEGGLYAATSDAARLSAAGADARPEAAPPGGVMPPAPPPPPAPSTRPANAAEAPSGDADAPAGGENAPADGEDAPADGEAVPEGPASTAPADAPTPTPGEVLVLPASKPGDERPRPVPATSPAEADELPLRPPARVVRGGAPGASGNAVYYIHADGLVETIFRRPVVIHAMIRLDERLLLGTGDEGQIFTVTPGGDEVAQLADTESSQVTALAAARDGGAYFATANGGSLGRIAAATAETGTFTSPVLDAEQVARWGTLRLRHATGRGAKLTVATRSGNVSEPDEKTWSDWSAPRPVKDDFLRIHSPAARFLQYRLSLTGDDAGGPVIRGVEAVYQVGNLAPTVSAVAVKAAPQPGGNGPGRGGDDAGPRAFRLLMIQADDANGDSLEFTVHVRQADSETWIELTDELTEPQYAWDTRTVPDGEYVFRVTACDTPDNPPDTALRSTRISERFVVDNTRPVIVRLVANVADGVVTVRGRARDAACRIVALHYAVDSADEWVALLPTDGICDDADEQFAFKLNDLAVGAHRIAVKAVDLYGNVAHASVAVTIE
ncbi:MAG: hypothetical protein ACOC8F_00005 [Planctomycetota bacterium]